MRIILTEQQYYEYKREGFLSNVGLIFENNEVMVNARKSAIPIAMSLMRAFEGVGTDENAVLSSIRMIKSKEVIYQLDKILKSYKRPGLKDYINDEMSDYDGKVYREIWSHLGKFGVTGANYNEFLSSIGSVVSSIGSGVEWLKKNGIGKFFETIREFLFSGWGVSAQLFLDSFGIGAIGVASVWGMMSTWDLLNVNVSGWGNFLISALGLLTAGAMSSYLAPLSKMLGSVKGGISQLIEKIMSSKIGQKIIEWLPKISEGLSKIGGLIGNSVKVLVEKLGNILPSNWVSSLQNSAGKVISWCESVVNKLVSYSTHETSDNVLSNVGNKLLGNESLISKFPGVGKLLTNPKWTSALSKLDKPTAKLIDKYIHENLRKYGWEYVENLICSKLGYIACEVADKIGTSFKLRASTIHAKTKAQKTLSHDLSRLSKDELKNLTPDELRQYKQSLGQKTQKFIQDTQSTVRKTGNIIPT